MSLNYFYRKIVKKYCFFLIIFLILTTACSTDKTALKEADIFDPEASLKKANELITEGKYEEAREILESIIARDASQHYSTLAKLRIADTYFEDESYEEAAVEYESFLDIHPYHKYSSYAQYMLAMSYFRRIKTVDVSYSWAKRALREFEKLQRNYPRNPYMDIVESRIKACKRTLAEYEFYVGSFYFKKGSFRAAARRFNGLLENYPDSNKVAEALYFLGLSYENLGQRDKAVSTLNNLIEKFPNIEISNRAKEVIASFKEK
jgi:outer membrane protein assembly factor BamD